MNTGENKYALYFLYMIKQNHPKNPNTFMPKQLAKD